MDFPIADSSNLEKNEDENQNNLIEEQPVEEPIIPPKKVFIRDVKNKRRRIFR